MKFYYLVHLQYLGFRYHGWQKQQHFVTIQGSIEKALTQLLKRDDFIVLGASRTDSMVSALHSFFELIVHEPLDPDMVLKLNTYLPPDIRILRMEEIDRDFKVIASPKVKEYLYFFSCGEKNHPFAAPFITHFKERLDVELMNEAARCFVGTHSFHNFCYKPKEGQKFERQIKESEVLTNHYLMANFFPEESYVFRVCGRSFMRHQVRMMMGALIKVGLLELSLSELVKSLKKGESQSFMIAPASGLILNQIILEET